MKALELNLKPKTLIPKLPKPPKPPKPPKFPNPKPEALNPKPYLDPQVPSNIPQIPTIKGHKDSIKGPLGGPDKSPKDSYKEIIIRSPKNVGSLGSR